VTSKGEELLAEFRRQRRAGDPRLTESDADPLLGGGPDGQDD